MLNPFAPLLFSFLWIISVSAVAQLQTSSPNFKVIAFYTAKHDQAHISFVHEANTWFAKEGREHNFSYDSTADWRNLNEKFLRNYDVVLFLDTRPDSLTYRNAFEKYMNNGGAWMGFHFAGFALTPSAYPQNWDWYHEQFLGAGEYKGNTWRPTSAILKVENQKHPATLHLPATFKAAPNEWYSWKNDLRDNSDIEILLSIDAQSFPLGTGPKEHEIWKSGYYPVVWTNKKFNMIYLNMGHNDIDYEHGTNRSLSSTFQSEEQNKVIIDALIWLETKKR